MVYFHTKDVFAGDDFTAENGGYYENAKDGCPALQYGGGRPIGFDTDNEPSIAGSKSPEASLWAVVFNNGQPGKYYIYRTQKEFDRDLSNCGYDFDINEEVRWYNPEDDPIHFSLDTVVTVPQEAVDDILYAYYGRRYDPDTIWATEVKKHLRDLINGGRYPDNLWEQFDHPNSEMWEEYGMEVGGPSEVNFEKEGLGPGY